MEQTKRLCTHWNESIPNLELKKRALFNWNAIRTKLVRTELELEPF